MPPISRIDPVISARLIEQSHNSQELLGNPDVNAAVASITSVSRMLTRVLVSDSGALGVLADLDLREPVPTDSSQLEAWNKRELLRIAARDLTGLDSVDVAAANLSQLAEDVLQCALATAGDAAAGLAIIAMGKLGGNELNYASDIDVMLVGECSVGTARKVLDVARTCFRVDTALRPEGNAGVLVRSLSSYETYWNNWASAWEFQALLKARPIAGPPDLLQAWQDSAEAALWTNPFAAEDIRAVRDMKNRAEQLVNKKGLIDQEVKRGRGGIRDVEFSIQLLQLVHGRRDPSIRSKSSLSALRQLADGGYIDETDAIDLSDAYRFLRTVEHRLQLVEFEQTHTVPTEPHDRNHLAQSMDLDLETFDTMLRNYQSQVRHAHERLYFRPLLEQFSNQSALMYAETAEERLNAFGFTDATRTRAAINELTQGLARSSKLMQQMMPLLMDWLSSSPDPDAGLLGLRHLISGSKTPNRIVAAFRDSPEVARRICVLLGTSAAFTQSLIRDPELIDDLRQDGLNNADTWLEQLEDALDWRSEPARKQSGLARFNSVQRVRIAMFDALNLISDTEASRQRSALADAIVGAALTNIEPQVPIALIGMGRYGGSEIGHGSDLDVVVVYDGKSSIDQTHAINVAQALLRNVSDGPYKLYDIDYDLRPEGKQGVLARSIDSIAEYYNHWAATWERQALVRARFVAGDVSVADSFFASIDDFVWGKGLDAAELKEIRHLKARMERERISGTGDPRFHLKLGPGTLSDVEWTVQLLQLIHDVKCSSTLPALAMLEGRQLITTTEASALHDAWTFCQRLRNRLALIVGSGADSLPSDPDRLAVLARSLEMSSAELREEYLRRTRRSRQTTMRLFYGSDYIEGRSDI